MAKKKQASFADLVGDSPTVNSIEAEKEKRVDEIEQRLDDTIDVANYNAKVTERLARKIDKMAKVFNSKRIKKLFENATKLNKLVEKKSTVKSAPATATKVDKLGDNDAMLDILNKILKFMEKSFEEDRLYFEEKKNYEEEQSLERSKKQKEMIDSLKSKKKDKKEKETAEKEDENSDILSKIMGFFGGMEALAAVGSFFVTGLGATLLPIVGGIAALAAVIWAGSKIRDWLQEKQDERAQKAGGSEAVQAQKEMQQASAGDSYDEVGSMMGKENEDYDKAKDKYDKAVQKKQGIVRQYMEGKGYKLMQRKWWGTDKVAKQWYEDKNGNEAPDAVLDEASKFADEQLVKKEQPQQTAKPAAATPSAPAATPTPAAGTPSPTATPPATPAATATPAPAAASPVNQASASNADLKLDDLLGKAQDAISSATTNISNLIKDRSIKAIPPVRNQEETFQKMIMHNTRLV